MDHEISDDSEGEMLSDEEMIPKVACRCGEVIPVCGACGFGWAQQHEALKKQKARGGKGGGGPEKQVEAARRGAADDLETMKQLLIGLPVRITAGDGTNKNGHVLAIWSPK